MSSLLHAVALLRSLAAERVPDAVERAALTALAHELLGADEAPPVPETLPSLHETVAPPPEAVAPSPEPAEPDLVALREALNTPTPPPPMPPPPPRVTIDLTSVVTQAGQEAAASPEGEQRRLLAGLEHAARCLERRRQPHRKLLQAAATVCSRLHAINRSLDAPHQLHVWLREHCLDAQHYLDHMRLEDPASTEAAAAALAVLQAVSCEPRMRRSRRAVPGVLRPRPVAAAVPRLAALLKGRCVLLMGNDGARPHLIARARAHGLNLRWVGFDGKQSIYTMQSHIRQADVAVVAVLIRWSPHASADARMLCEGLGRAFVLLPAGYGLNTLSEGILERVGDQLAG